MFIAQVEASSTPASTGFTGGWPEEGTVWESVDQYTEQFRRVVVVGNRNGAADVEDLATESDPFADYRQFRLLPGDIDWDRFGTEYTLVEPARPDAEPTGIIGGWPDINTVWDGIDATTGQSERLQVQVHLTGNDSVVVTGPGEDDHEFISWEALSTGYTLVAMAGGRTIEELQEQLEGRVQIPDEIRAQLTADQAEPQPPVSGLQGLARTATETHGEGFLAQRWGALRARFSTRADEVPPSGGTVTDSLDEASREEEEVQSQRQGHRGPHR